MSLRSEKDQMKFECRIAKPGDEDGIMHVLTGVASEIPVPIGDDDPDSQEIMRFILSECCESGESLVATDANGMIIGFVLAKADVRERFFKSNQAVSIRYIGVKHSWRQRGIFADLMQRMKAAQRPLKASVLHTNKGQMADRLSKLGFTIEKSGDTETDFAWRPSPHEKLQTSV